LGGPWRGEGEVQSRAGNAEEKGRSVADALEARCRFISSVLIDRDRRSAAWCPQSGERPLSLSPPPPPRRRGRIGSNRSARAPRLMAGISIRRRTAELQKVISPADERTLSAAALARLTRSPSFFPLPHLPATRRVAQPPREIRITGHVE